MCIRLNDYTPFLGRKQNIFRKNEWLKQIAYEYIRIVITYTLWVFLSGKHVLCKFVIKRWVNARFSNVHLSILNESE